MVVLSLTSVVGIGSSLLIAGTTLWARLQFRGEMQPDGPKPKTVLAIGARPDDLEFGCGAALLRYREDGYETHAVVLNCGDKGAGEADAGDGEPAEEAVRGAQRMQLSSLLVLDVLDAKVGARRAEIKSAIEEAVTGHLPDTVLTHNRFDPHDIRRLVFNATIEACCQVPTVLCYEHPDTLSEFRPNFFVDASRHLEHKIDALKSHAGEASGPGTRPALAHSMARMRGHQGSLPFAEAFEAIRVRSAPYRPSRAAGHA